MSEFEWVKVGMIVWVTGHRRAHGKPGGWARDAWRGEVVKVNRTTADVRFLDGVYTKRVSKARLML